MYGEDKYAILEEKKKWVMGACISCLLLLLLFFSGEETETSAGEIMMPTAVPRQEPARKTEFKRILGAEKAALGENLADPFSIAHLTREEMEQAKAAAEWKMQEDFMEEARESPVPQSLPQEEKEEKELPSKQEGTVSLQGIVTGEHGRMAILKQDGKSISVTVGERVDTHVLKEIGEREVIFDDGERLTMQIP